jgi:hypothetical protein
MILTIHEAIINVQYCFPLKSLLNTHGLCGFAMNPSCLKYADFLIHSFELLIIPNSALSNCSTMVPFSPTYSLHSGFIFSSSAVFAASIRMCTLSTLGSILALMYAAGAYVVVRCLSSLADITATVNIAAVNT